MSLLIEGMEMPTDDMKNIMILADGRVFQFSGYGNPKPLGTAVPIPPHGRLGDLDALLMRINHEVMEAYMDGACYGVHPNQEYLYLLGEIIDDVPTVIPASESKERPAFLPQYELTPRREKAE